jgi:hypothetical protein
MTGPAPALFRTAMPGSDDTKIRSRDAITPDENGDKGQLPAELRNGPDCSSFLYMTTRPERFRVRAMEFHIAAQKAKDPETRKAYLELMRGWRELADEIERFEHSWLDQGWLDRGGI